MSPFGDRGAAGFARALESGTAGSLPGLALAARLRAAGASLDDAVAPRPEFRDALRMRLLAVATVQASAPVARPAPLVSAVSWRRRAGAVAAGAMASVVAVTGVAVAGSQSLPGDPFYGVKRTVEALQLGTADGEVERGTQHLELAATRLREVRGLTLGRDAATSGPELGPAALDGGFALRSASRALASDATVSAPRAELVRETLAAMDEQTREGSALLTGAYRSSRAPEPLRVLSRFATRQSAGLQELLPALPARTRDRARASLALLSDVRETTSELLSIGTCGTACDPSTAAPALPDQPGATPVPQEAPCDCSTASPEPTPAPSPSAPSESTPAPQDTPAPQPEPSTAPEPQPSSPAPPPSPSPSPSGGGLPVPVPSLPVPVPSLPVPLPTPTVPAADAVPGALGSSSRQAPDAPATAPLAPVAPLPPRP